MIDWATQVANAQEGANHAWDTICDENERLRGEVSRLALIIEAKEQAARKFSCECDKDAGLTCVRCQCLYAGMDIPYPPEKRRRESAVKASV